VTATEPKPSYKYVGTRPVRHDGLEKVTGRARFAADLNMSGQLHGIVVRSPHAHARIVSIDTSEAEAMGGVKAVITGDDFPAVEPGHRQYDMCINVIARDKVFYEGHAVAAVAASTRDQAQAAAAAVKVEYDVLPAVLTIDQALAPGAPVLHAHMMTAGADPPAEEPSNIPNITRFSSGTDMDAGFAEADLVIEREFTTQPVHQGYIEPHACVADTGQDGHTTIWCSSQGHFNVRSSTATLLGWENTRIG